MALEALSVPYFAFVSRAEWLAVLVEVTTARAHGDDSALRAHTGTLKSVDLATRAKGAMYGCFGKLFISKISVGANAVVGGGTRAARYFCKARRTNCM